MPRPDVAVIVTTYQMPRHLRRALESIACQRTQRAIEVIVADDGSTDETQRVVSEFAGRAAFRVALATHPHVGFQAARCRNDGVRNTTAPHLFFFDGDCILPPDHIERHLSAYRTGTATSGYCVRLDEAASREIDVATIRRGDFAQHATASQRHILRTLHRKAWWYGILGHATKPALKSTDFSLSRADFERVNGFDEEFRGWGCEDDDLGRRLRRAGVRLVSVLDRTCVYHLWHPPAPSKPDQWRNGANARRLEQPGRPMRCRHGLHAPSPDAMPAAGQSFAEFSPSSAIGSA